MQNLYKTLLSNINIGYLEKIEAYIKMGLDDFLGNNNTNTGSDGFSSGYSSGIAYVPTVIVADDDSAIRNILSRVIGMHLGCNVLLAEDGVEAVEHVKRLSLTGTHADLYWTDVMMPRKTGFEFLSDIRAYDGVTPAIVMSGYISDEQQKLEEEIAKPLMKIQKPMSIGQIQRNTLIGLMHSPNKDITSYFLGKLDHLVKHDLIQDYGPKLHEMGVIDSSSFNVDAIMQGKYSN